MKLTARFQRNFIAFVEKNFQDVEEFSRGTGTEFRMTCPFCNGGAGREVSFDINLDKSVTRCWRATCGYSGSAAWFVKDYLGIPYPEALELLEGENTADLTELRADLTALKRKQDDRDRNEALKLLGGRINEWVDGAEDLGWESGLDDVMFWLEERGFDPELFLEQNRLFYPPQYGRYQGRVLFEVTSAGHRTYLAYGIEPDVTPKTLNPSGEILSRMLYNYDDARYGKTIFVCEGVFDVARLKSWGLDAVAIFGTNLSVEQVYLLSKTDADEICVLLDHNTALKSIKAVKLLGEFIMNKTITMGTIEKEGADPDELTEDEFMDVYNSRRKYTANDSALVLRRKIEMLKKSVSK